MKKLKTLTTSTAIALASVGVPAFAQEAQATPVPADTVNEPALVSKSVADTKPEVKKSSDVKPALDAQASTVKQVEAESQTAKDEATSANQAVTTTETALTSAKEDLKSAEAVKANATEENITATKAKQDANVKAQEANQKATEASTEAIKAQTETVATETANVASATSKKAEADKAVTAKEANVKAAEDALNGSGLGEAKASLAQAEKDIEQANANISSATKAVETAKKADSNRAEAIKQATNNVNVKNDALKLAKEMMDADKTKVEYIQTKADALKHEVDLAQNAVDTDDSKLSLEEKYAMALLSEINDDTGKLYFKEQTSTLSMHMKKFAELVQNNKYQEAQTYASLNLLNQMYQLYKDEKSQNLVRKLVGDEIFNRNYTITDGKLILSKEDYRALNIVFSSKLNAFRKLLGVKPINQITEANIESGFKAMDIWNRYANSDENKNKPISEIPNHILGTNKELQQIGAFAENTRKFTSLSKSSYSFNDLSNNFTDSMLSFAFLDAQSSFGHYKNLFNSPNVLMGIYQNNKGGAFFTHSFYNTLKDKIIYSQNAKSMFETVYSSLDDMRNSIKKAKEYLYNDLNYAYLLQEYDNFFIDSQNEYMRTKKVAPEKQARLNAMAAEIKKYEELHNVPLAKFVFNNGTSSATMAISHPHLKKLPVISSNQASNTSTKYEYLKKDVNGRITLADGISMEKYKAIINDAINKAIDDDNKVKYVSQQLMYFETIQYVNNVSRPFIDKIYRIEEYLNKNITKAKDDLAKIQTALANAKAELAAASRKYASALEAKTDAEKELASKTASPLQTEVAEKNLQLANLALTNAQERKANAEKAVENFSRSQAEKQTALETAKNELATAKTAQKDAETALTSAQAKLQAEENKLKALQDEQAKLHAEKDQLVSDAKAIATELSAYLNAAKNLADAQAKVADLETKLTQAKSAAKLAQDKLDAVTAKLKAEQAKLAEIQEEFDKLVKAERKDYYNLSDWYLEYLAGKQANKKIDTELKKVEDSKASQAGNWIESSGRWWYKHADGSYTTNGWEQIKDKWYYFDQAGWMQTGWVKTGGTWYYLNKSGSMATDWVKDNGTWYYLNKSGSMATGWVKDNGTWYYLNKSGSMATGWIKDNGTWYYLNNSGSMVTGWVKDNGSWYYLDKSGAMTTGWFTVSGKWYYAYNSGALAVNTTTPDGYKVNANGEWVG
ncbi:hypothetical protein M058_01315 [Streptococcus mitis 17/34]|nr:hypothetical protein M058_01315 [Streptococcus mitis 17/34]